jgi:Complex I intermediate-associated protein 30 (CIA30)
MIICCHTKSDQVMGGVSMGNLLREEYAGRIANVLRGKVSLENNGGFIQMATNLGISPVDASKFVGIELDVHNGIESDAGSEQFNVQ